MGGHHALHKKAGRAVSNLPTMASTNNIPRSMQQMLTTNLHSAEKGVQCSENYPMVLRRLQVLVVNSGFVSTLYFGRKMDHHCPW